MSVEAFLADIVASLETETLLTHRIPVESVSWDDAVDFCRHLSELPEEKKNARPLAE